MWVTVKSQIGVPNSPLSKTAYSSLSSLRGKKRL